MKVSRNRAGVSEVVAALLLLSITVGVFGVFYTYYVSGLNSSGGSVAQGIQDSAKATGELMSLVSYQVQGSTVTLYLYNYGLQPITLNPPQQAFLISGGTEVNGIPPVLIIWALTMVNPDAPALIVTSGESPACGLMKDVTAT